LEIEIDGIIEFKTLKAYEALDLVGSLFDKDDTITVYADIIHYKGEVLDCIVVFGFSKKLKRAVRMYIPTSWTPENYATHMDPCYEKAKRFAELLKKYGYNVKLYDEDKSVGLYQYIYGYSDIEGQSNNV